MDKQKLFDYLSDLGLIPINTEMQEIRNIVLDESLLLRELKRQNITEQEFFTILKSNLVLAAIRHAVKSPFLTDCDNCQEPHFIDFFNFLVSLKTQTPRL